jgi:ribonuclease HII
MIKADTKVAEVSAASILAKVVRDREMVGLAREFPQYGFDKHKGYGTKAHIEAIKQLGYCNIHRKTFKLKTLEK